MTRPERPAGDRGGDGMGGGGGRPGGGMGGGRGGMGGGGGRPGSMERPSKQEVFVKAVLSVGSAPVDGQE